MPKVWWMALVAVSYLVGRRQVHKRGRDKGEVVPPWLPRRNRRPDSAHQQRHVLEEASMPPWL